jgi:diguanylate cyclase (GGDEF)-like protein
MNKVEGDISRHAFELDELAEELTAVPPDDPASIMAAAAAMLVANRRLQSDLANAQTELQEQQRRGDALAAESRTDTLTGLANRRSFDEELGRRLDQWRRHKVPVSLLMIDIDRFKQINDRYGHPAGDAVLKWVADVQSTALRQMDVAARFGGEEFAIILPGTKLADAGNVAERLRATVAAKSFQDAQHEIPVTVSIGVTVTTAGDDPASIVKRADEALYTAKNNGRDRACLHNGSEAVAIQADKSLVRHPFDSVQQVAIYHGGAGIPPPSAFNPMRSSDISAKGISFITDSAPDCKAYVVRLGAGKQLRYMVANIANVTALSQDELPQFRVGCSFVARLETEDAAARDGADDDDAIRSTSVHELVSVN